MVLIEPPALWVLPNYGRLHEEVVRLEKLIPNSGEDITEQTLDSFLNIAGFVPPGADARQLPQWPGWIGFRQSLRNTPALFTHTDDAVADAHVQSAGVACHWDRNLSLPSAHY